MSDTLIPSLGKLVPVDLRSVWPSEPNSFTPWLALPDNLQALASALNLPPLELVQVEQQTSEFRVDIVARITGSDEVVVIENQLERTDHSHLGQALTYAAGTESAVIVWVAPKFAEGHRAALEWLNRKTSEDVAFFGVEIEAWRIGESKPAPRFNVVVRPNNWAREVRAGATEDSAWTLSNIEYWQAFRPYAAEHCVQRPQTAPVRGANYYYGIAKDPSVFVAAYTSRGKAPSIGAYIAIFGAKAEALFTALKAEASTLEVAIGAPMTWRKNAPTAFWIMISKPADIDKLDDWPAQHQWLAETMGKLKTVFEPRIAALIPNLPEAQQ